MNKICWSRGIPTADECKDCVIIWGGSEKSPVIKSFFFPGSTITSGWNENDWYAAVRVLLAESNPHGIVNEPPSKEDGRNIVHNLNLGMRRFEDSVNRMIEAMGMQAENDQRKIVGDSMAYSEDDFRKLLTYLDE